MPSPLLLVCVDLKPQAGNAEAASLSWMHCWTLSWMHCWKCTAPQCTTLGLLCTTAATVGRFTPHRHTGQCTHTRQHPLPKHRSLVWVRFAVAATDWLLVGVAVALDGAGTQQAAGALIHTGNCSGTGQQGGQHSQQPPRCGVMQHKPRAAQGPLVWQAPPLSQQPPSVISRRF